MNLPTGIALKPRHLLRPLSAAAARLGLLRLAESALPEPLNTLRVLTYHRVAEDGARPDLWPDLVSSTPEQFARQLDGLRARYQFVSLDQVLAAIRGEKPLPRRAILLTFDDAYADFETGAWRIAKERSIPCVLFVPTGFPGDQRIRFWWDMLYSEIERRGPGDVSTPVGTFRLPKERDQCFRQLREWFKTQSIEEAHSWLQTFASTSGHDRQEFPPSVHDWPSLRRLAQEGVSVCPHTRTHPALTMLEEQSVLEEMTGSISDLRAQVGNPSPAFAYPAGLHDDAAVACAQSAGFEIAFTINPGIGSLTSPLEKLLRFPRIGVTRNASPEWIRFKLIHAAYTRTDR